MPEVREVFFVDGVRTPFGKAGPKGQYWRTRADDMAVKAVRELLRRNPEIPQERADAFAVASQRKANAAWENGVMRETVIPMAVFTDDGWKVADRDEFLRPETTMDALAALKPAFRAGGRVTAGNSAGLTDGATAAFLASAQTAEELGPEPKLRLVGYAYAGV